MTWRDPQPIFAGMLKDPDSGQQEDDLVANSDDRTSEFARWTFLTNHAHVLAVLDSEPDIVLRKVAVMVGITERAVQRIIHELEEDGFIEREKIGRQNRYRVIASKALRHPIEAHRSIGDLLNLINN